MSVLLAQTEIKAYLVPVPSWKWGHISSGVIKYYYSATKLNYTEAVAYCANHNSFLLEILTQDDLLYFQNYLNSLENHEDSDTNFTLPDVWLGHSLDRQSNKWRQKSTGEIIEWKGWLDSCMTDKGMDSIVLKQ